MLPRRRALFASALALAVAAVAPASANASIAFRSAASASAQNAAGAWVVRPAGLQKGDVMVATVSVGGAHLSMVPLGWKAIRTTTPTTSLQQRSFYRVATQYELPTWYFGALSGHSDVTVGIAAYSGVDTGNPIDVVADAAGVDAGAIPSVTTTAPGDMVVGSIAVGSSTPAAPESSVAVRYSRGTGSASLVGGDFAQPTAGATGARSYSSGVSPSARATQAIALRALTEPVDPGPGPDPGPAPKTGGWHLAGGGLMTPTILGSLPVFTPKRKLHVSARGTIPVPIACPPVAPNGCRGTIALTVLKPRPKHTITTARRRKIRRRRKVAFHVAAGAHKTIRAPVPLRALRRYARHRRARVRLRMTVHTPAGNAAKSTTVVVLARRTPHRFKRRR